MSLFLIIIFLENQSTIFDLKKNGNICGDVTKKRDSIKKNINGGLKNFVEWQNRKEITRVNINKNENGRKYFFHEYKY